jgi:hypothetical protein
MPFTFAHPAAAIPLARPLGRYGVLSALVIGSMTPDFWIFLPVPVTRSQTHGLAGLLWFCAPMGILMYLLFHAVLKQPLLSLLPAKYAARLAFHVASQPRLPRAPLAAVLVSVIAGSLTHVLWDQLTHAQSRGVTPLQEVSGAAGLALLAWWSWRWFRGAADPADSGAPMPGVLAPRLQCYLGLALLAVMLGAALVKAISLPPWQSHSVPAAIAALQGLVWGLIGYSVMWQLWNMRRK